MSFFFKSRQNQISRGRHRFIKLNFILCKMFVKIAVTGSVSSGKTWLCNQLLARFGAEFRLPENEGPNTRVPFVISHADESQPFSSEILSALNETADGPVSVRVNMRSRGKCFERSVICDLPFGETPVGYDLVVYVLDPANITRENAARMKTLTETSRVVFVLNKLRSGGNFGIKDVHKKFEGWGYELKIPHCTVYSKNAGPAMDLIDAQIRQISESRAGEMHAALQESIDRRWWRYAGAFLVILGMFWSNYFAVVSALIFVGWWHWSSPVVAEIYARDHWKIFKANGSCYERIGSVRRYKNFVYSLEL